MRLLTKPIKADQKTYPQYPENKFNKGKKDIHTENNKTLLKKLEHDLKK